MKANICGNGVENEYKLKLSYVLRMCREIVNFGDVIEIQEYIVKIVQVVY